MVRWLKYLLPAALFACSAPLAQADEIWDTPRGQMIYLSDVLDAAVFQLHAEEGEARYYFPGLAGDYSDRSVHHGYWISHEPLDFCSSTLVGLDGFAGTYFGRATIVFDGPAFPTGWTILDGACWEEPFNALKGSLEE